MRDIRPIFVSCIAVFSTILLLVFLQKFSMFAFTYLVPALFWPSTSALILSAGLDWHPPTATWINDLDAIINGTGTYGFIFNGSELPDGVPYGTYNYCNMPHVRVQEYEVPDPEYKLEYVEVVSCGSGLPLNSVYQSSLSFHY